MEVRADRYAGLLTVSAKAVVTFAQKACGRLLAAGRLPAEDFLAASAPALLFPGKAVAAAQLRLIGTVITAQPQATDRALAAAAEAFGHQRLDVQEAALDLIARYGLPEGPGREVISERAALLAPALEHRAISLGLPALSPVPPASPTILADGPARTGPGAGDPLPPPLADPGELIQLLTQLMEDAPDPLAVERAVAGAVRLCGLPVAERARLAAPLLKRAEERLHDDYDGPFGGREIRSDIAGLTLAWGRGWTPGSEDARRVWGWQDRQAVLRSGQARTMSGILTARIWEASALVAAGRPAELLAEPEFGRGAISPDRLIGRLGSWAGRPCRGTTWRSRCSGWLRKPVTRSGRPGRGCIPRRVRPRSTPTSRASPRSASSRSSGARARTADCPVRLRSRASPHHPPVPPGLVAGPC